ncbi:MAG: hypothetical protein NTX50_13495 [Candidatus Sumerlaeota bacterium]|nr:hypothetical protein [Candidatus Sumerlaeota bacterium]
MSDVIGPTKLGKLVGALFIIACLAGAGYFFRDALFPALGIEGKKKMQQLQMG